MLDLAANSHDGYNDEKVRKVALKGFFKLMELWKVKQKDQEVLISADAATLSRWKNGLKNDKIAKLSADKIDRISYLLGIHEGLRMLYSEKEHAYGWLQRPNKQLDGKTPLQWVVEKRSIGALQSLRYYVDDLKGGVAT